MVMEADHDEAERIFCGSQWALNGRGFLPPGAEYGPWQPARAGPKRASE